MFGVSQPEPERWPESESPQYDSVRPETVKQTPAKPESRSQAKTLPVSSGLWTQDVTSREQQGTANTGNLF